jgi:hypothetical protein
MSYAIFASLAAQENFLGPNLTFCKRGTKTAAATEVVPTWDRIVPIEAEWLICRRRQIAFKRFQEPEKSFSL